MHAKRLAGLTCALDFLYCPYTSQSEDTASNITLAWSSSVMSVTNDVSNGLFYLVIVFLHKLFYYYSTLTQVGISLQSYEDFKHFEQGFKINGKQNRSFLPIYLFCFYIIR